MAKYIRDYPQAPTADEVKTGYAPSTIRGTPFVKFLFWTFAGLAITFAITWGATSGLAALEDAERGRPGRFARQREVPFEGPRLQPSRTHPTLDYVDMQKLNGEYRADLAGNQKEIDEQIAAVNADIKKANEDKKLSADERQKRIAELEAKKPGIELKRLAGMGFEPNERFPSDVRMGGGVVELRLGDAAFDKARQRMAGQKGWQAEGSAGH
jgi:hypothetical protein